MLGSDFQSSPHLSTEHLPAATHLAQAGKGEPEQGWGLSPTPWPLPAKPPQSWTHSLTAQETAAGVHRGNSQELGFSTCPTCQTCDGKHPPSQWKVLCYRQRGLQIKVDDYFLCDCWYFNIKERSLFMLVPSLSSGPCSCSAPLCSAPLSSAQL